jgi:hypothetical protein
MPEPKKTDPKSNPQAPKKPNPSVPHTPGRAKRGSDFRDHDVYDAPVEDPEDPVVD